MPRSRRRPPWLRRTRGSCARRGSRPRSCRSARGGLGWSPARPTAATARPTSTARNVRMVRALPAHCCLLSNRDSLHRLHDPVDGERRSPHRLAYRVGRGRLEQVEADLVVGQEARAEVTDAKPFCGERLRRQSCPPRGHRGGRPRGCAAGGTPRDRCGGSRYADPSRPACAFQVSRRSRRGDAPVTPTRARPWEAERIRVTLSTRWRFES